MLATLWLRIQRNLASRLSPLSGRPCGGVRAILESHDGYAVCGEAGDGVEAVKKVLDSDPDVAILDITMPLVNGIDAARAIVRERPHIPIIILSMHSYSQSSGVNPDFPYFGEPHATAASSGKQ